jgi:hypothetical protein
MLDEFEGFDKYIDNLRNELDEPIMENQNKFTLDLLDNCDKFKFKLKNYNIKKVFLLIKPLTEIQKYNYVIIQIKFKSKIFQKIV